MKEFKLCKIYGGQNVHYIVVCKTKKRAVELLNVTNGFMSGYGYTYEPKTPEAIANPEKIFAYADSGLVFEHRRDVLNKILPHDELHIIIDELKKIKYKR